MQINNTMANELIVDFPEHSHRHYMNMMCLRDLECECNNHAAGRGSSPHQASSRGHSHERCHRHRQPETSSHRSCSKSSNNDSSTCRGHSDHPRLTGPTKAGTVRSVRFAKTSLLKLVTKHEDREDVDLQDLWYSEVDLELMKLAVLEDVLKVRELMASGVPIDYFFFGENDDSIVCLMGIENRCSKDYVKKIKACRERCVHAVLQEQMMHKMMDASMSLHFTNWNRQDLIALASFSQTRNAATRAHELGLLHQASCVRDGLPVH